MVVGVYKVTYLIVRAKNTIVQACTEANCFVDSCDEV